MKKLAIAFIIILMACFNSYAASGWTAYGTIGGVQADYSGITIYTNISNNPSRCSVKNTFYYPYSYGSALGNRMYATILAAKQRGTTVRFYVSDTCNSFSQTRFTAVNSK